MVELKTVLSGILTSAVAGRGAASVSVIDSVGRTCGAWIPETALEPAFLAYSITKRLLGAGDAARLGHPAEDHGDLAGIVDLLELVVAQAKAQGSSLFLHML